MALTKITGEGVGDVDSLTAGTTSSGEFNALTISQANNTSGNESRISFKRTTDAGSGREVAAIVADRVGGNDTALVFETNTDGSDGATERVRISQDGDVLINGTSNVGIGRISINFDRATHAGIELEDATSSAARMLRFKNTNGTVGEIVSTGSSTAYATSSDYRLKESVVDMTGAIDRVKQLAPKRFNFIVDADTTVDGFLAHEAQAVVPEAITGTHDEVDDDGNPVYQSIDQSKLVPLLTGALKEAVAKIEALEARVKTLEDA